MFIGEFSHTLDDKGRVAIPVAFRPSLTKGAVVTRGLDSCLFIYTAAEWKKVATKLAALPFARSDSRAFARFMLAGAMPLEIDKQGRALVPEYLRRHAGLGKNVVIAGLYNRLEIWGAEAWEKYKSSTESRSGDIAEKLGELGV